MELATSATSAFAALRNGQPTALPTTLLGAEQSNSSIQLGDRFIFKLFRRVEAGLNPDIEIGRFLTEETGYANAPPVAGAVELRASGEPISIGVLHGYVPNQGTAWKLTQDELKRFYEQVLAETYESPWAIDGAGVSLLELTDHDPPEAVSSLMGTYLSLAELLGQRTAELHLSIASNTEDPAFKPEPFSQLYQRSLYQSLRKLCSQSLQLLAKRSHPLPGVAEEVARQVLERQQELQQSFEIIMKERIIADRIRLHGDFHLGQVLFTGKDFVIIDFEGEPARSLGERRLKRSSLVDVAGMIRSYHYAAWAAMFKHLQHLGGSPDDQQKLLRAARNWYGWTSAAFLRRYLQTAQQASFIPQSREQLQKLLNVLLLEKAIYELKYELNNRPDWVEVPLRGIIELLDARSHG
jgi:maltose alpha-D-glucosyltransferase/alpha-amylase